jgi:hypothetical protein
LSPARKYGSLGTRRSRMDSPSLPTAWSAPSRTVIGLCGQPLTASPLRNFCSSGVCGRSPSSCTETLAIAQAPPGEQFQARGGSCQLHCPLVGAERDDFPSRKCRPGCPLGNADQGALAGSPIARSWE